jgi:hypothetical protein
MLIYVADGGSSGEGEDTVEIEVECQFTFTSADMRYYPKTLILSARALNDFAVGRLAGALVPHLHHLRQVLPLRRYVSRRVCLWEDQ